MNREIIKDGKFLFAEITVKEFEGLNKIKFDRMFINYEQIKQVMKILNISNRDDLEYVRAIRNSIIKHYSDKICEYRDKNFDKHIEYQTRLSAITSALDTILES